MFEAAQRPSFCASRPARAAQGTAREARRKEQGRLLFAYFLLAKQEKVGRRAGANTPRGLSWTKDPTRKQTAPAALPGNRGRLVELAVSYSPAAARSAWALSVLSHENSGSSRPKCP